MRKNSTIIPVIFILAISIILAICLFLVGKFSPNYENGEEFRLVNVVFMISCVVDFLFYWVRMQSRKNKFFKLTRQTKEPDSIEYQEFKSEQRLFLYLLLLHFILLVIFSIIEFSLTNHWFNQ